MISNIHASCIDIKGKGVLILGDSGMGKSDISLQLIENHKAKLVADDRVDIFSSKHGLIATCPKIIQGLLEVRGIGIVKYPYSKKVKIKLAVQLTKDPIERLPEIKSLDLENNKIPLVLINPLENSAPAKILAALRLVL